MEILKTIKQAVTPTAAVEQAVEAAKSIEQITAESAAKFPSTGDAPQPETPVKVRKPRKDLGQPREPRLGKTSGQGQTVDSAANGQIAAYTIDKQIVEKTCSTVLHTVDSVLVRRVYATVVKLGGDESLGKEMAANSGLTTGECQLMSELTGVIFEKHGLLTGYAPEILLCILLGEWSVRVTLTMRKLNAMVEEVEKKKKNDAARSD